MCECLNIVTYEFGNYFDDHMLVECDVPIMWHYTSVDSFVNIVQSNEIRFTDCLFLNDKEEFNYIFAVLNEYIKQKRAYYSKVKTIVSSLERDNLDFLSVHAKNKKGYVFENGRYYVLSGSSNPDSLPLWNYYSKNNFEAYAIRINLACLFHDFAKYKQGSMYAGKVIYDLNKQLEIIEAVFSLAERDLKNEVTKIKNMHLNHEDESDEISLAEQESDGDLYNFINHCRLFFKDASFSFEEEIRVAILASPKCFHHEKLKINFTNVNGIIKPSLGMSFVPDFPISSVVISPLIDIDFAKAGIERLFESLNIKFDKEFLIDKSKLKIRY